MVEDVDDERSSLPSPLSPTSELREGQVVSDFGSLLAPGELLEGVFEIKRRLGRGGMGEVYEAFDQRLARRVAIKVAWVRLGGGMQLEAQTLASLNHPGILRVHHMGTHRGLDYLVMELLPGESLEARLAAGAVPIDECVRLLEAVCGALMHLHEHGIVHRDLKPGNIMLAPGDRVVLVDFGISGHGRLTGDQAVASGSPHYMAPESFGGEVRPGDAHLVDLYALGVVAFQLVTGRLPFEDGTPLDLARQHLEVIPPRASAFRERVPPRFDHMIAALMAKQPDDRPSSIQVVQAQIRALRRVLEDPPTAPPPRSVLIVDDDPAMCALLRACTEQAVPGVEIEIAGTGTKAIELASARSFDFIFLDLELPDVNGLEVCMHLHATSTITSAAVIVVSAHDDAQTRASMRRLGVSKFVSKRLGTLELEDTISDLLMRSRRITPRAAS